MRVTEQTNLGIVRDSMQRSRGRLEKLQHQGATMKKLNAPSDDPIGAAKLLEIRTDKVNNDQFAMNAKLAETWLENTDHALSELGDIIGRAKEIAISQSSGASSNEHTRLAIAEEVTQLFQQAVSVANRRIGDRYIFGGYKTNQAPIDRDGKYKGDDGNIMVEISKGIYLSSNVPGYEAFNTHPKDSNDAQRISGGDGTVNSRSPASVELQENSLQGNPENVNSFDELQNLRIGLLTGDLEQIRSTLERLDQIHTHVIATRAKVGSRMAGMQSSVNANERTTLTNAALASQIEDADMAQVMSDIAKEETVFRSSLQSAQKLIQPTLMEFLK